MAFSFGSPAAGGAAPAPAFSFGAAGDAKASEPSPAPPAFGTAAAAPPTAGFGFPSTGAEKPTSGFGAAAATSKTSGFGASAAPAAAPPSTTFSFAGPPKAPAAASGSPGGTPAPEKPGAAKPATAFSFGAAAETKPAASGSFFGGAKDAAAPAETKPAASGAVSFGGFGGAKDAAAPAETKSAASGGFAFAGAKEAAAPAETKPAASGGFSFSGAKEAAAAGESKSAAGESKPAAGVGFQAGPSGGDAKAATGAFGFGTATAPAGESKPETGRSGATRPTYVHQTIEEVVNGWNEALEEDAAQFLTLAQKVGEWDAELRANQAAITEVAEAVQRLALTQSDLDRTVDTVADMQREMGTEIDKLEGKVDQLFSQKANRVPEDADLEREQTYKLAADVQQRLMQMHGTLHGVTQTLNRDFDRAATSGPAGAGSTSLVLKTLNNHHNLLEWLDRECRRLDEETSKISAVLDRVGS